MTQTKTVYIVLEDYTYSDRQPPAVFDTRKSAEEYYLACLTTMIRDFESYGTFWNIAPPEVFLSFEDGREWFEENLDCVNYFIDLYAAEVIHD